MDEGAGSPITLSSKIGSSIQVRKTAEGDENFVFDVRSQPAKLYAALDPGRRGGHLSR